MDMEYIVGVQLVVLVCKRHFMWLGTNLKSWLFTSLHLRCVIFTIKLFDSYKLCDKTKEVHLQE